MPLRDHFHAPLKPIFDWHSFHNAWATYIAADLNKRLPKGYFAAPNVQFAIEIDVATFETLAPTGSAGPGPEVDWAAPAPTMTAPMAVLTDLAEIKVLMDRTGTPLAAAIELVSPSNKDRPASRDAFVNKCAAYLQLGNGLMIVDVVTERRASLHDALIARVAPTAPYLDVELYATSYRPAIRADQSQVEIWPQELALGQPLPTLPLWLRGGAQLRVDLNATYEQTCREMRLPMNAS